MAEYYPLLSRAVAGLRDAPAAQRQAIYERARGALLGQLRSMQPAVPTEAIDRESTELDAAIARLESEMAGATGLAAAPDMVATERSGPAAEREAEPPPPAPPAAVKPAANARPRVAGKPVAPVKPLAAPPRSTAARPAAEALTRIIADRTEAPVVRASRTDDEALAGPLRAAPPLPSAPKLTVQTVTGAVDQSAPPAAVAAGIDSGATVTEATPPAREEPLRPAAPRPVARERFNPRFVILAGIGALIVLGIAYTAWRLRDKPEALARSRAALIAAQQADSQTQGKVSNRADAGGSPAATVVAPITPPAAAVAPMPDAATPAVPPAAAAQPAPAATPALPAAPATPTTATAPAPSIPVAQRAAFLVDAPDDPAKIKTFVGTVVWRTENVSPGQGQPLAMTVHAEIEVPDAALKLSMIFQKNFEAQFPASHTLDLRFTLLPNNTYGGVKQINVPQMRKDDSPAGDMLVGLPVTITENYFLVGLSRGDAVSRNLDLIKTRNWIDIPILLTSGKVAKVTFEKGATGQQVIDEALQSWQ